MKKVKVVQKENEEEVSAKIIAQSIKKIGDSVDSLNSSGLNDKAIKILLAHASGENQATVQNVLWGLRNLRAMYLK